MAAAVKNSHAGSLRRRSDAPDCVTAKHCAFADYVTVTSEQDAKIYCMKHSTCQGYVQKVMRDGSIEWQVPKGDEAGTAISKTYTQYEDSVPDYYAYEKAAGDNLCGNDDTCVGYYEDTALSKTYNILPFTVEEEGIYVGQTFAVEKDAVKHCAASATCEGVSKVETYDPFVAAEEIIINYKKIFNGECTGSEILAFAGDGDNPCTGDNTDCIERCYQQCTTWNEDGTFTSKGFILKATNNYDGRCYCEAADSSTCTRGGVGGDYFRYDYYLLI